jgi:hypothetical protein
MVPFEEEVKLGMSEDNCFDIRDNLPSSNSIIYKPEYVQGLEQELLELKASLHHNKEPVNITAHIGTSPYKCPVCGGNGLVPNGFYSQTGGKWWSTSTTPETCKSCSGTGIVWR